MRAWSVVKDWQEIGVRTNDPIGGDAKKSSVYDFGVGHLHRLLLAVQQNGFSIHPMEDHDSRYFWKGLQGGKPSGIAFSPNDAWIVVSGGPSLAAFALSNYYDDGTFHVGGDEEESKRSFTAGDQVQAIRSFAFLDDERIAMALQLTGGRTEVEVREFGSSWKKLNDFKIPGSVVGSPYDGKTLATNRVVLHSQNGALEALHRLKDTHLAEAISFSGDGQWFVTGGRDGRIMLWKTATGERVGVIDAHRRYVTELAFSPNAKYIVSGGMSHKKDPLPKIWDAQKIISERPQPVEKTTLTVDEVFAFARLSPDGSQLSVERKGLRTDWKIDPDTNTALSQEDRLYRETDMPDSDLLDERLVHSTADGTRRIVSQDRQLQILTYSGAKPSSITLPYSSGEMSLLQRKYNSVKLTLDGKFAAVNEEFRGPYAHLYDADEGTLLATFRPDSQEIEAMEFTPDGRELVLYGPTSGSLKGRFFEIWNVKHHRLVGVVDMPQKMWINLPLEADLALELSRDGKLVLAGPYVIDLRTLRVRTRFDDSDKRSESAQYMIRSNAAPSADVGWIVTDKERQLRTYPRTL